jgi:hypothetical protein
VRLPFAERRIASLRDAGSIIPEIIGPAPEAVGALMLSAILSLGKENVRNRDL